MQEKKNKRLAILLCALCFITGLVYYFDRPAGTVEVDKDIFKNYDLKDINQVVLESRKGKVDLKFNGAKWEVNNQFNADATMIQVLFATFQQAEPKRPVAASVQDSLNRDLKENGVRVSLIASGKTELSFYAGGNAQKTQAFFSLDADEPKSYVVTIPGYRVYVSGIFEAPEKDWRDKLVFAFNWRNFERLETRFPQTPADNFDVGFHENHFTVQGLQKPDTAKLNTFLDDVSLLTVEEYIDLQTSRDTLSQSAPMMIVTVKDIGKRVYTLQLYRPSGTTQRIPGLINGAQWAYFDSRKVQNIFKRRTFFGK